MEVSIQKLSTFPLLASLTEQELQSLANVLNIKKFAKGSYIIHEDDMAYSLMFVASGRAKATRMGNDGREIVLAFFEPGDFFGELALLTDDPRSANVLAQTETILYTLPREIFEAHLRSNPGLSLALIKELAHRLRMASEKIGDLALLDVYRRVARTLKTIGKPIETEHATIYEITERPTHQELASIVGTSREMVTRALHGLEEDGCIETVGKTLRLKKLPR